MIISNQTCELQQINLAVKNESDKILVEIYRTYLNNNKEERLKQAQQLVATLPDQCPGSGNIGRFLLRYQ
jgi:hypothetical protein